MNELSGQIIKCAIDVHKELGPGLFESVYHQCLRYELECSGLSVQSEVNLPINYRGLFSCDNAFRIDLLVESQIIVELKSVEKVVPVHLKQLLTYLRLANKPLGLLLNFNEVSLTNGISRVINT